MTMLKAVKNSVADSYLESDMGCSMVNNSDNDGIWEEYERIYGERGERIIDEFTMFYDMPNCKYIKQDGSVREYYDAFTSNFNLQISLTRKLGLDEGVLILFFHSGLSFDIEKWLDLLRPTTLEEVYALARREEANILKNNHSKGVEKENSDFSNSVVNNDSEKKEQNKDIGNGIEYDEIKESSKANGLTEVSIGLMGTCLRGCDDSMGNVIPGGDDTFDGHNKCEWNKGNLRSLVDEQEIGVVEVDMKSGIVSDFVGDSDYASTRVGEAEKSSEELEVKVAPDVITIIDELFLGPDPVENTKTCENLIKKDECEVSVEVSTVVTDIISDLHGVGDNKIDDRKDIESNSSGSVSDNGGVVIVENPSEGNGNDRYVVIINEPHIFKGCDTVKTTSPLKFDKMFAGFDVKMEERVVEDCDIELSHLVGGMTHHTCANNQRISHGGMGRFEKKSVTKNGNEVYDQNSTLEGPDQMYTSVSLEPAEGRLKSAEDGNGSAINMAVGSIREGVEEINELLAHRPLPPGFNRVGIGDLRQDGVRLIRGVSKGISRALLDADVLTLGSVREDKEFSTEKSKVEIEDGIFRSQSVIGDIIQEDQTTKVNNDTENLDQSQWVLTRMLKERLNLESKRLLAHYDNSGGSSFLGIFIQFIQKRKFREWLIPWAVHSEGYKKISTYNSGEGSFSGLISPWCKFWEWLIPWEVHSDCCGLVRSVTWKPEGVRELVHFHLIHEDATWKVYHEFITRYHQFA